MFHTQSPTQSPAENLILVVVNVHQISALIKAPYTIHGAKSDFNERKYSRYNVVPPIIHIMRFSLESFVYHK